jgi:hypothetical protein
MMLPCKGRVKIQERRICAVLLEEYISIMCIPMTDNACSFLGWVKQVDAINDEVVERLVINLTINIPFCSAHCFHRMRAVRECDLNILTG